MRSLSWATGEVIGACSQVDSVCWATGRITSGLNDGVTNGPEFAQFFFSLKYNDSFYIWTLFLLNLVLLQRSIRVLQLCSRLHEIQVVASLNQLCRLYSLLSIAIFIRCAQLHGIYFMFLACFYHICRIKNPNSNKKLMSLNPLEFFLSFT